MKKKIINIKTKQGKSFNVKQHEVELFKIFESFTEKNSIYILFFLISIIVFFVFKDFIFLNKIYLFKDIGSDSINDLYPKYYILADNLIKEGIPKWSFNQGMGQNIFSPINPFSLFILLMGKENVYYTVFFAEAFKIFFAGLFFYLFLKKIINSSYVAIIGGVLYSFTGFIFLAGGWFGLSTEAVYIALLLYSFEKLYQDNNWILFPISFFLITLNQPFDLYLIGLFLTIYIVFRLIEENERKPKKILILFTKVACLGILGVAISSFFFINIVQVMLESPRGSGEASYSVKLMSKPIFGFEGEDYGNSHYITALMRFFSNDILGTGSNYEGWFNYLEAPMFYCGLISLVFLLHFLSLSDKRKKIIYFVFLLVFFFPVIFPYFRYAMWLFTGNYYRVFSLFVVIIVLLITLKSIYNIDNNSKANTIIICATLLLLLCFLYYPYSNAKLIDKNIRSTITYFLIIYSFFIYLIQFKSIKNIVKFLLLFMIVIELIYFSNISINKRPVITGAETKQKVGYNDYTVDAVKYLKSLDKTFFRINKNFSSGPSESYSLNDACIQDFYGTRSYSSFNQLNYIKFLHEMGFINNKSDIETHWVIGLTDVFSLHSFASIKYSFTKAIITSSNKFFYDSVMTLGDVKILKNKCPLPLGFTYDKFINLNDFRNLQSIQKFIVLYKAFVADSASTEITKNFQPISDTLRNCNFEEFKKYVEALKEDTLVINKFSQNNIKGEIKLKKKKMLFFSIPYDKGWSAKVDEKTEPLLMINIGFTGLLLDKGEHNIELSFLPPFYYTGAYISLISVFLFIVILAVKFLIEKRQFHI